MTIAVIDYGAGNLKSVTNALRMVTQQPVLLVDAPTQLAAATHIILPGVGAFGHCMQGLQRLPGMIAALEKTVLEDSTPFLGICVGMQLLFEIGHEHGRHPGLGWLKGEVVPLKPDNKKLKIPHMGWNELVINEGGLAPIASLPPPLRASPCSVGNHTERLFTNISSGDHAYFVHSYHCVAAQPADVTASVEYGGSVTAAVTQGNIHGVQFHPEKSQQTGLRLFHNFLNMRAACHTVRNASPS